MSTITVRNKLEIRPGLVISVPGCEPTSSLTGTTLLSNLDCGASVISLADALRVIPGSRVVGTMTPTGHLGTGLFFELPSGPPPDGFECDCDVVDYYKILRDNARPVEEEEVVRSGVCSGFNFSGCVLDADYLHTTRDPDLRPNSNPL